MSVMVIVEQRDGKPTGAGLEAASAAGALAKSAGKELHAALLGKSVAGAVEALGGFGIKQAHVFEGDSLEHYSHDCYVPLLAELAGKIKAEVLIGSASSLGRELCASLASKLNVELVQDAVALEWQDGVVAKKPIFAGKVLAKLRIKDSPQFVSLRPNLFSVDRQGEDKPAAESGGAGDATPRVKVVNYVAAEAGTVDLSEAKVIVSGGHGLGDEKGFEILKALCSELGAALGASRSAVDAGWIPQRHQVGQTGKVVNPEVYMACGISGAIQHQAGMRTSKIVVAINKDAEAPIFKIADYGIVGDLFEIVPLVTEELKKG